MIKKKINKQPRRKLYVELGLKIAELVAKNKTKNEMKKLNFFRQEMWPKKDRRERKTAKEDRYT